MYLLIAPAGGKLWRLKYRVAGKEKLLALGAYPLIGLKEAREKRDSAKKQVTQGVDPGAEKKRQAIVATLMAANTFSAVAREFIDKRERDGLAEAIVTKARWFASLLELALGARPVSDIEPAEVLAVLKEIEKQGNNETAKRTRAFAARVFRYAIVTSRAKQNPAADLGMALVAPKVKHYAAIIDPLAVGALLRAYRRLAGTRHNKACASTAAAHLCPSW